MSIFSTILSLDNPVFRGFITYGSVLVLKMMAMAPLTGRQRLKHGIFASPEDHVYLKKKQAATTHEDIERVRKAHLNDLENIPIFFVAAMAYMLTNPDPTVAINLFRAFTIARFIHTFVYAVVVLPQPARGLSWIVGYGITGYMALKSICYFNTF